ncbi:hypothetical protein BC830DRAFT_1210123 [Chytriomyces sp. MP71]|nr:hypothetical protein BC830DRAFT_1210123 [Chytriomyces sp. MP71]
MGDPRTTADVHDFLFQSILAPWITKRRVPKIQDQFAKTPMSVVNRGDTYPQEVAATVQVRHNAGYWVDARICELHRKGSRWI